MSTHPYIPLYVDDYDAATAHLTVEEDGAYSRLLRLCWRTPGCSLPNEPAWIARKIRLSMEDYERIAKPVIDEFFTLSRGRLIQKRLRDEYDDISRKKSARKNAGKKGGEAKALKTKENTSSNASDLPADTRAFPYPEPNPEPEEAIASSAGSAPADPERDEPVRGRVGRRKPETCIPDGYPDAKAIAEGQARIREAGANIDARVQAEKFRNHAMQNDRRCRDWAAAWRNWVVGTLDTAQKSPTVAPLFASAPAATVTAIYDGPPALRESVVAAAGPQFAVKYIDQCRWDGARRVLIAKTGFAADEIRNELRRWLAKNQVCVEVAGQMAGAAA